MKPVLRFAPSPTGYLSLGNVRTALFNWVYARANGGKFLLRIEDTDEVRSNKEHEQSILTALKWLKLDWDGEVTYQSKRRHVYEKHLLSLIESNTAYYCFCSSDDLEKDLEAQKTEGLVPVYRGPCKDLSPETAGTRAKNEKHVIRFRMPETKVNIPDLIRGSVVFDTSLIGDIIIAKDITSPLYNFAVVVDDHEFNVTHVIRGEDHISNTPKQWMISEALKFPHPEYGHLPLILGPDRKKLSKRYLQGAVKDYIANGYLPEALINFLMLIGWHPKHDKELLSMNEILEEFTINRVQKGGGIFDPEKLDWMNARYIRSLPFTDILPKLKDIVPESWLDNKMLLEAAFSMEKTRLKKLSDFVSHATFIFEIPSYDGSLLIWKNSDKEITKRHLKELIEMIEEMPDEVFVREAGMNIIMKYAETYGRGEVLWPLRTALSGMAASPGPMEIMQVLGRHESLSRLRTAVRKLEN